MLYNRNEVKEQGNAVIFLILATALIILGFCYFMNITPVEFVNGLQ